MKQIIYLFVLFLCVNAKAAGDSSGIEPVRQSLTAAISGDNVELSANGVALKDITWQMRIES